jgi:anti-sigma regulatory factor (Ser/Thr protein kinase)/ABC-type transporter Mla MlaB component
MDSSPVAGMQQSLLSRGLPVLPLARIAAAHRPGEPERGGGDWFDAIPLTGGKVALVVGDLAIGGLEAAAAMGQLRAVLAEVLRSEGDPGIALCRMDVLAARTPEWRAATLAVAVLDPRAGSLRYATCGHPALLVVGADGAARYLDGARSGPLGMPATGYPRTLADDLVEPGGLVALYTNGLVTRPGKNTAQWMAGLASLASEAVTGQSPADQACQLVATSLQRSPGADDAAILLAQRLAAGPPPLVIRLPAEPASLAAVRREFCGWLTGTVDPLAEPADGLELALAEIVSNAVEHAYPPGRSGRFEVRAVLHDDGQLECTVTDHGSWREPDPADSNRGYGLMVASHLVDRLRVGHPPQALGEPAGARGTVVTLWQRLRKPAVRSPAIAESRPVGAARPAAVPFSVQAGSGTGAFATCRGPIDQASCERAARQFMAASRAGTIDLTVDLRQVTELTSAGIRTLCEVREQLNGHRRELRLIVARGSAVQAILEIAQLPHTADISEPLTANEW